MATLTQTVTVEPCSKHGQSLETQALDSKQRMPPLMSLVVVHYFLLLSVVGIVIIIPTASEYAERLGGSQLFAGLTIGRFRFSAFWHQKSFEGSFDRLR